MTIPELILGYTWDHQFPIVWDPVSSFPHRIVVGGTGRGKTSFLLGLIYQQLRRAGGVIFVDGKANPRNLLTLIHLARQTGRWSLVRAIFPGEPWSHTYNPLHEHREIHAAVNFLLNLLPPVSAQSEAQHYRDLVQSFLLKALEILRATGKTATLRDVLAMMTAPPQVIEERFRAELTGSRHHERLGDLYFLTQEILRKNQDALSGIVAQLQSLLATDLGNFISTVHSDVDFLSAVDLAQPVYVALPTSGDPTRANALGRAFLADTLAMMAQLTSERRPLPTPPCLVLLDEFGSYATPDFVEMFRKARESGVQLVASVTNISDLQDPHKGLTPEFPDMLTGNARLLFLGSEAPGTLAFAERYFGEEKQLVQSYRESLSSNSAGHLASAEERFLNPWQGTSRAVFDQAMEKREPKLEKEWLHHLGFHEAIVFFRRRPTLVHLVRYFASEEVLSREPANEVPRLPKTPRQPVALTDYVRDKQIEAATRRAEKGAQKDEPKTKTDVPPAPATPRPVGRPRGSGRRTPPKAQPKQTGDN